MVSALFAVIFAFIAIYVYFKWSFLFWKKKNVPTPLATFPIGTTENPLNVKNPLFMQLNAYYKQFKANRHFGFYLFSHPAYVPTDLNVIKDILTKDFNSFANRGVFKARSQDPLSQNLFGLEEERWKPLRQKLTNTFTSGKLKAMFSTLIEVGKHLEEATDTFYKKNEAIDIKEIAASYTTDTIGSCAFGLDCNSFKDPNSEFRHFGEKSVNMDIIQVIKFLSSIAFPGILNFFNFKVTNKNLENFYMQTSYNNVRYREAGHYRNDFVQLLIELKNQGCLTMNEIAAQCFIFFLAGYETSASTISHTMFELAKNQTLQDKVRNEIRSVLNKNNGEISYDALKEMTYLDQVIDETLRLHPPAGILNRQCTKPYKVPGTETVIDPGQNVWIPVYSIQHDESYFPNPEEFDPDRFSEENKHKIVPYSYLPFGEGPRICIGIRFGLIQIKIGLCTLLKNYKFTLDSRTTKLEFNPKAFLTITRHPIWLNLQRV